MKLFKMCDFIFTVTAQGMRVELPKGGVFSPLAVKVTEVVQGKGLGQVAQGHARDPARGQDQDQDPVPGLALAAGPDLGQGREVGQGQDQGQGRGAGQDRGAELEVVAAQGQGQVAAQGQGAVLGRGLAAELGAVAARDQEAGQDRGHAQGVGQGRVREVVQGHRGVRGQEVQREDPLRDRQSLGRAAQQDRGTRVASEVPCIVIRKGLFVKRWKFPSDFRLEGLVSSGADLHTIVSQITLCPCNIGHTVAPDLSITIRYICNNAKHGTCSSRDMSKGTCKLITFKHLTSLTCLI